MQLCWSVWASKYQPPGQQVPAPLLSYKIAFCPLNQFQVAKLLIAVQFNFQVRIAFWIPNPISDFHPAQSDEENVFSWNPVSLERFTKWGSKGHFAATQFRFILQNLTTNVTSSFFRQNSFLQPISGVFVVFTVHAEVIPTKSCRQRKLIKSPGSFLADVTIFSH